MGKWLKKYMKIEHLQSTLENKRLFLGDPRKWTDKNDSELIEIYRSKKEIADIRVTCLTIAPDRVHFWEIFGEKKAGVCLWFDEDKLLADIKDDGNLRGQKVSYYTPYQLENKGTLENLPFSKRQQYRDEREFRVLWENNLKDGRNPQGIKFSAESLKKIYFNTWLCDSEYKEQRENIEQVIKTKHPDILIRQNKILRFQRWIDTAKKVG